MWRLSSVGVNGAARDVCVWDNRQVMRMYSLTPSSIIEAVRRKGVVVGRDRSGRGGVAQHVQTVIHSRFGAFAFEQWN